MAKQVSKRIRLGGEQFETRIAPAVLWEPLGPMPMENNALPQFASAPWAGRVMSISVPQAVTGDGDYAGPVFMGTDGGGIWSSTDVFVNNQYNPSPSWTPLADNIGLFNAATGLGAGAGKVGEDSIAVIPRGDQTTIVAATAGGVLVSDNEGQDWGFAAALTTNVFK